ncbi:MAG TPA: hypothetical protein P5218_05380, partial [Planctomycetota bacterium]|nr:hypothetical protein [Planctomycetota bacterium]
VDDPQIPRLARRLAIYTLFAVGAFVVLAIPRLVGGQDWSAKLPWFMTLGQPLDQWLWLLFFPLWFGCAMPLIRAMRPEMVAGRAPLGDVRVASLVSRRNLDSLPTWTLWLPWVLWVLGFGIYLWRFFQPDPIPLRSHTLGLLMLGISSLGLLTVPMLRLGLLNEPEPMDPGQSEELARAYASYRRWKSLGLYSLCLFLQVSMVVFAACFLLGWLEHEGWGERIGFFGGLVGSVVGGSAGIFGSVIGHQRGKIEELRQRLSAPSA